MLVDSEGELDLVAILLRSDKRPGETEVFTKQSPPDRLLFAKMQVHTL